MKRPNIFTIIGAALWACAFLVSAADADIYSWTDENGVSHFTNYAPPKQARLIMKTPEIPHDQVADIQRQETDRMEVARQELAEREAFLLQQQQEAERRIALANARADAALQEAQQVLQEAEAASQDAGYERNGSYVYGYGYYPYYRHGYYPKYGHPYKKKYYRYGHWHQKHDDKHGHKPYYKKYDPKRPDHYRKGGYRAFDKRSLSHRSRTALFRGRFGRF